MIRSLLIQPLNPLNTHLAIAIARSCIRSGARSEHLTEEKLTVPPIPIGKKESRSQSEQQSDKTASETDKNVEPDGSEGKGENNG